MSAIVARSAAADGTDDWSVPALPTGGAKVALVENAADHAHFVFKKGHLGRYRFNLMVEDGRVGGDVRIATAGIGRVEKERAALLQMRRVAEALLGSLDEALAHLDQSPASDDGSLERS